MLSFVFFGSWGLSFRSKENHCGSSVLRTDHLYRKNFNLRGAKKFPTLPKYHLSISAVRDRVLQLFQYPLSPVRANNIGKDNVLNLFMLKYEWPIEFDFFQWKILGGKGRKESRRRLYQGDYGCVEGKVKSQRETRPHAPVLQIKESMYICKKILLKCRCRFRFSQSG